VKLQFSPVGVIDSSIAEEKYSDETSEKIHGLIEHNLFSLNQTDIQDCLLV